MAGAGLRGQGSSAQELFEALMVKYLAKAKPKLHKLALKPPTGQLSQTTLSCLGLPLPLKLDETAARPRNIVNSTRLHQPERLLRPRVVSAGAKGEHNLLCWQGLTNSFQGTVANLAIGGHWLRSEDTESGVGDG